MPLAAALHQSKVAVAFVPGVPTLEIELVGVYRASEALDGLNVEQVLLEAVAITEEALVGIYRNEEGLIGVHREDETLEGTAR